jgi:hypothetical protein
MPFWFTRQKSYRSSDKHGLFDFTGTVVEDSNALDQAGQPLGTVFVQFDAPIPVRCWYFYKAKRWRGEIAQAAIETTVFYGKYLEAGAKVAGKFMLTRPDLNPVPVATAIAMRAGFRLVS